MPFFLELGHTHEMRTLSSREGTGRRAFIKRDFESLLATTKGVELESVTKVRAPAHGTQGELLQSTCGTAVVADTGIFSELCLANRFNNFGDPN